MWFLIKCPGRGGGVVVVVVVGGVLGGKRAYFVQSEWFLNRMQSWPSKSNPATEKVLSLQFYQACHSFTPVEEMSLFHGQIRAHPQRCHRVHLPHATKLPPPSNPHPQALVRELNAKVFGLQTLTPSLPDCTAVSVSGERRCAGDLISGRVPLTAIHQLHQSVPPTPPASSTRNYRLEVWGGRIMGSIPKNHQRVDSSALAGKKEKEKKKSL